jgi:adenine-specific DNA-methyltransferase
MKLSLFNQMALLPAIKALFKELNVPVNYVADEPTMAQEILKDTYKDNATFKLIDDVYFVGMVDDAAFSENNSIAAEQIKSDYDGILIFGLTLHPRENNLLPTRSQLAEIARAFNREFYYTPVIVVYKYGNCIAFANTERLPYKQAWREGEKAGKVSLLRDIDIQKPHRGHEDIINQLRIPVSGTKAVDSFAKLYAYWQEVFSVSLLSKKFYQELSNWYFWAIKNVTFPNKPTPEIAHLKGAKLEDLVQGHNATNVIRLLTRLLFTWFIKEKKLIPEELFDLGALQKNILKEISPYHEEGIFKQANQESVYYKAILQNLFFASLNCPIEADGLDNRSRGFRGEGYGTHRGIDYLMRYKKYFKNPDTFLEMVNNTVPFLNGGLFECLDDKYQNLYIDGFSDQMTKGEHLIVPDYLFFGVEEQVDLSKEYGVSNSGTRKAAVKGLINILKAYKFTITENTPIEEDVALDPELLGKVFENLLASYNPETRSTARKQTGSFYTPREVVNYMVDESLIAYLKNTVTDWGMDEEELDKKLHELTSFDPVNPFIENSKLTNSIVTAFDQCKILDPACGSGAFPMGILQKMVHMLQKLDPDNKIWKEVQKAKAKREADAAFEIEDKDERGNRLKEIDETFDQSINDPDYARKLYLIENCIYGVDIQPIATQISKLRFFISLVVDQIPNDNASINFGIRPLPNLETKFVTANTLVDIEKPKGGQLNIFDGGRLKQLEKELKKVRSKLFNARTKETKLKYRERDEALRNTIAEELKKSGWPNDDADKLAKWDPYDQKASSTFFNSEWMFDIKEGFDVVIGNPPYVFGGSEKISNQEKKYFKEVYKSGSKKINLFTIFIERGIQLLNDSKFLCYIIPNTFLRVTSYSNIREYVYFNTIVSEVNDLDIGVFEGVTASTIIIQLQKNRDKERSNLINIKKGINSNVFQKVAQSEYGGKGFILDIFTRNKDRLILNELAKNTIPLGELSRIIRFGVVITKNFDQVVSTTKINNTYKPFLEGDEISSFFINYKGRYVRYEPTLLHRSRTPDVFENDKIMIQRITGGSKPLKAVFDDKGFYNKESIINIQLNNSDFSYYYILALLNSSVINWFYKQKFTNNSKLTVNLSKEYLEQIPIKLKESGADSIVSLVSSMLSSNDNLDKFNDVIFRILDATVFNLYFSDHMREREINVLELVERDVDQVMGGREFIKLSNVEKEEVIEQLQLTWSHPDNEVRNRVKLFAVRSPEILKPILEG